MSRVPSYVEFFVCSPSHSLRVASLQSPSPPRRASSRAAHRTNQSSSLLKFFTSLFARVIISCHIISYTSYTYSAYVHPNFMRTDSTGA